MIRIEHLTEAHLPAVAALHRKIFRSRMTTEELGLKYSTEHVGVEHGSFVAMDEGEARAFHGGLPQIFELDGREVLVGQSCDSMADPEARKLGLYADLFGRTEDLMRKNGAALMYGVGNRAGVLAGIKMGWRSLGHPLNRYSIRVSTLPVVRAIWRASGLRPTVARMVQLSFASEITELSGFSNSLSGQGFLIQKYTPELFRYKARNLGFGVRIGDGRVWLKAAPDLMVGDLFAPDRPTLRMIVERLKTRARFLGIGAIHCYAFPGVPLDLMLGDLLPREDGHRFVVSPRGASELVERFRFGLADLDSF